MRATTATSRSVLALSAALLFAGASSRTSADSMVVAEAEVSCCGCQRACGGGCGANCQCRPAEPPADPAPFDLPKQTRRTVDAAAPRADVAAVLRSSSPNGAANLVEAIFFGDGQSLVARHIRLQV